MRYIKPIQEFLSEAISMKMYKENLPKELWYDKSDGYKSWDSIFGKGVNRISIPLNDDTYIIPTSTPLMDEINSIFIPLGYKINSLSDYIDNKAYKIGDEKNPLKIGKLLSKIDPTLFKKYDTSTERKEWKDRINNSDKELKIIISRHPYDLLGMSSGRDWRSSSCMTLGTSNDKVYKLLGFDENEERGSGKDFIEKDIEYGTLVAYVVKVDDNNINNPISRLLIKPYINKKDKTDILWVTSDKIYGNEVYGFKFSVDEWLDTWQVDEFHGLYCIKGGLYSDGKERVRMVKPVSKWNDKDMERFLMRIKGKWKINEKGEVDVVGDVDIRDMNLTEIPVKFGRVSGDFYCHFNKLTSLQGCPTFVGGSFYCYTNKLTSLQGCPMIVGWDFYCDENKLTSLQGCPTEIFGSFSCSYNQLTSLKFAPTSVGRNFDCCNNQLTSLEFAPTSVGRDFYCSDQKNGHKFTEEDVESVCQVGDKVYV